VRASGPDWWRRPSVGWTALGLLIFGYAVRTASGSPIDSDGASNVLQAADLLHGNLVLQHWQVSDVSFYLTDLPLYAVLALIFGTAPAVLHVGAAVVFTAVVLLTALLAKGPGRDRPALLRAALAGTIVFVAPFDPAGIRLYLSAPDHLSTIAMGLAMLLIIDRARPFTRKTTLLYVAVAAMAELSDPMAIVVLALPIMAVSGLAAARRREGGWLCLSTAASLAVAMLGGLLLKAADGFTAYSPATRFAPAHRLGTDLIITYRQFLTLFGADFTGRHLDRHSITPLLHLLALVVVVIAVLAAIRRFFEADRLEQILATVIVVNLAAFTLTTQAMATHSARSFLAVLPCGAVLAARRLPDPLTRLRLLPAVSAVLAGCLALSLVALRHGARDTAQVSGQRGQNNVAIAAWLRARHLTYGLGSYWNASGVTVQSRGAVKVRPVMVSDGKLAVMDTEFDRTWYDSSQHVATFLVISKNLQDMRAIAQKTYGPPARSADVATSTILVWNRNLLPVAPSPRDE
jgi:hypothetical protein